MYSIKWDKQTGGIILTDNISKIDIPIRPVFFEELDLLGFGNYWNYPKVEEPLLWARGREYFYRGEKVAIVRGGSFYSKPVIEVFKSDLNLEPVDVAKMLEKNNRLLSGLVQKSLEFIVNTKEKYENKVDAFVVAFSGGKDSIVLLDLVQRVLEPNQFFVIFNDTWMEISDTYKTVEKAKEYWRHLKFYTARSTKDAVTTWKEMGPPSRIHRWCCTVHKSAPTLLKIREILGKSSAKVLVFDGVRGEESAKRAGYDDIAEGKKHIRQINARPIFDWNTGELFLYIFLRKLPLNQGYRNGLHRVGCAICPFSSAWSECIMGAKYKKEIEKFLNIIKKFRVQMGEPENVAEEYVNEGRWKARPGGLWLGEKKPRLELRKSSNLLEIEFNDPYDDWFTWVKGVGKVFLEGKDKGSIQINNSQFSFESVNVGNSKKIRIPNYVTLKPEIEKKLRNASAKAAYCSRCGVCQLNCPTGSLIIKENTIEIGDTCTHCGLCLTAVNKGCLRAASLHVPNSIDGGWKNMLRLNDYSGFGIRSEWLLRFLERYENWSQENNLGNRQWDSLFLWLKHSEIIDLKKSSKAKPVLTELGKVLTEIGSNDLLTWAVIWVNLARNSFLVRTFLMKNRWGSIITKEDLVSQLENESNKSERTCRNASDALIELFLKSPLGEKLGLCIVTEAENRKKILYKKGWPEPYPEAVIYSLYRYAEIQGDYKFTLRDLYDTEVIEGPYHIFGVPKGTLDKSLRAFSVKMPDYISVNFNYDLDNISLNENKKSIDVLIKYLDERKVGKGA